MAHVKSAKNLTSHLPTNSRNPLIRLISASAFVLPFSRIPLQTSYVNHPLVLHPSHPERTKVEVCTVPPLTSIADDGSGNYCFMTVSAKREEEAIKVEFKQYVRTTLSKGPRKSDYCLELQQEGKYE